jgi:hypothetical protein
MARREGEDTVAGLSSYGSKANQSAEGASTWRDNDEGRTAAIGEGLAAVAYALLDVATAIRENTEARQQ